jgi:4-hydroxyphenylpyruvate dioxygenase
MVPALSQVCTLNSSFEDDVAGYADAAATALELWLTKLETYLETHSLDEVKALAASRGLQFAAATFQGGLLISQGDARREAWAQFERRLEICGALGVPTLVIAPDFLGPFSPTDIERAQVSLKLAGETAEKHGVQIALEFQARGTFLNNLETAVSFVDSVAQPNVGICFDVFHYYMGPSKFEDLAYLSAGNLFHVQLCDVADTARELATDTDRILPGDGDFRLQPLIERFCAIGYKGYVSLEVMNPTFWQVSARQVGEVGLTALRMALGLT